VNKREEVEEETRSVLEDAGVRQNCLWRYECAANAKMPVRMRSAATCKSSTIHAPRASQRYGASRHIVHLSIQGIEKMLELSGLGCAGRE